MTTKQMEKATKAIIPEILSAADITAASNFYREIGTEGRQGIALMTDYSAIKVKTADDMEIAVKALEALKAYLKAREQKRLAIVGPIKNSVRLIDAEFKRITDKIEAAMAIVTGEILKYRREEAVKLAKQQAEAERKLAEEKKRIEAEAKKAAKKGEDKGLLEYKKEAALEKAEVKFAAPEQETRIGSTTFTEHWTFEIIDSDKVPRDFCSPNPTAIRAAVKAGARTMPGVRIYKTEISTTR